MNELRQQSGGESEQWPGRQGIRPPADQALGQGAGSRRRCCRRMSPTIHLAPTSAMSVSIAEAAILSLHAGDGRAHHRHPEGSISEGGGPVHVHPQRRRHEESRRPLSTQSVGRSTRSARRSFAPQRCCNCCSAMSDAQAAASTHCAATRIFRAPPTWAASSTSSWLSENPAARRY